MDSSTSTTQIVVEFDKVGADSDACDKLIKKLSKSPKSLKGLKNLQKSSV